MVAAGVSGCEIQGQTNYKFSVSGTATTIMNSYKSSNGGYARMRFIVLKDVKTGAKLSGSGFFGQACCYGVVQPD